MLIKFVFFFVIYKLSNDQEINGAQECMEYETNGPEHLSSIAQKSRKYGFTNDEVDKVNVCKEFTPEDKMDWDDILSFIEKEKDQKIDKKEERNLTKSSSQLNCLWQSRYPDIEIPLVSNEEKDKLEKIEQIEIYLKKQGDAIKQVSKNGLKFEATTNINSETGNFYFLNFAKNIGKQSRDLTCTSTQKETVIEKISGNASQSNSSLTNVQASDQYPVTQPQALMQTQNYKQNGLQINLSIHKEYSHIAHPYNRYENMQNSHYPHEQTFLPQSNSFTLNHSEVTASYPYMIVHIILKTILKLN